MSAIFVKKLKHLILPQTTNQLPSKAFSTKTPSFYITTHSLPKSNISPNQKFAVFSLKGGPEIANKQFFVSVGDRIMVDKLYSPEKRLYDVKERIVWDEVLLVGSRDKTAVGTPLLKGAKVIGEVEELTGLKEIIVFKKKRRKGYNRMKEFVPQVTVVRIKEVNFDFGK